MNRWWLVLAARLIASYSCARDAVVDLSASGSSDAGDQIAVPFAAAVLQRSCLILTALPSLPTRQAALDRHLTEPQRARVHVHTPLVDATPLGEDLGLDEPSIADLVIARHPHHGPTGPAHAARVLCAHAATLLRPGGVLAVVLDDPAPGRPWRDDSRAVLDAASDAGLGYLQHIVALRGEIRSSRLTRPRHPVRPAGALHIRAHTDVLIFQE